MRVVELDRDLVGQRGPARALPFRKRDRMSCSEQLTRKYSCRKRRVAARLGRVVRVEDARQRLGRDVPDHGADEIAVRELREVEVIWARRRPRAAAC